MQMILMRSWAGHWAFLSLLRSAPRSPQPKRSDHFDSCRSDS